MTPERYATDIAPARTFGFEWELDQMRNMGLDPWRDLDTAVCFGRETVMNPGGLRFRDECCRHKVLDLIGDLALIGKPLLGHVIAERAGHAMHTALVARIMSDPSLYESCLRSACDASRSRFGILSQTQCEHCSACQSADVRPHRADSRYRARADRTMHCRTFWLSLFAGSPTPPMVTWRADGPRDPNRSVPGSDSR